MKNQKEPLCCPEISEDIRSLILDNLALVKYVVGKMRIYYRKDDEDDILGYGIVGLIEAAKRFDKSMGTKFYTFAVPRIRGAVIDYLRTQDLLPRSLRKKGSDIREVSNTLWKKLQREPTPDEIAEELGIDITEFYEIQNKLNFDYFVSLDNLNSSSGDEQERSISNILEDQQSREPYAIAEDKEDKERLKTFIKRLPENERLVITLYYLEDMLIKEISKTLDISESRVSQLHHKALFSLRMNMNKF